MIKRYSFTVSSDFIGPRQTENGGFVDYEDYAALQQKLDAMGHESGKMMGLLNDICRYHEECTHDDMMHALIPLEYVSAINTFVGRDVDGKNSFAATDAYLNSVRAEALREVINSGEFSNWVNQGLQGWINRFLSGTHDTADKAG